MTSSTKQPLQPSVVNQVRIGLLSALFVAIALIGSSTVVAQPRDVYFEKAYCATERGRSVRVQIDRSDSNIPNVITSNGRPVIQLNFSRLRTYLEVTARFLFARACFEASAIDARRLPPRELECEVIRYIARRYNTGRRALNTIAKELLDLYDEKAERIARKLYGC